MRATVVVPTYNEIDNIDRLLKEVRAVVPDAQVLVVDDGSPDGTADRAEQLGAELGNIAVLRRTEKNGLGKAYRAGLRRAIDDGAEICVQMDADLSHDPAVLPALIANVEHGADLAIGSRYVPGGRTVNWPRRRRWLSRWGNRYAAGVLGLAINDATAGFRAYRSQALLGMGFEQVKAEGYGFQIEMTYRLVSAGGKVVEFPISFQDRTEGVSKMSGSIIQEALLRVAALLPQVRDIRRLGAAAPDLCYVAAGRLDVYFEQWLGPWDLAAGELIAREAGCISGDLEGGRVRPASVLVANPALFGPMQRLIAGIDAAITD